MNITRAWAMPNHKTFSIPPIAALIGRYLTSEMYSVDPFANGCKLATVTNDLNPEYGTHMRLDAIDFLKSLGADSVDLVLYDPPYSPRQVSEMYKRVGFPVTMETTQSSFWSRHKDEIARITKVGGIAMSFGWNSTGVGKTRGFEIIEILIVCHGGAHNDTICTVEKDCSFFTL